MNLRMGQVLTQKMSVFCSGRTCWNVVGFWKIGVKVVTDILYRDGVDPMGHSFNHDCLVDSIGSKNWRAVKSSSLRDDSGSAQEKSKAN